MLLPFQRTDLWATSDFGQRVWMSDNDAEKLRRMYFCNRKFTGYWLNPNLEQEFWHKMFWHSHFSTMKYFGTFKTRPFKFLFTCCQ